MAIALPVSIYTWKAIAKTDKAIAYLVVIWIAVWIVCILGFDGVRKLL